MTSTPTRPVDNVVITTKGLQEKNINILAGTTVENKGKLILNALKDIFKFLQYVSIYDKYDNIYFNTILLCLITMRI